MKGGKVLKGILLTALIIGLQHGYAQERNRILFVVDGSLSMKSQWHGGSKWEAAVDALSQITDSLAQIPHIEMGLRMFGTLFPQPDHNCHDSYLLAPIDTNNVRQIKRKLDDLHPKGMTPLVYALEKSVADFGGISAKNVVIIITDGDDACDRDICSIPALYKKNNITLRPYIIGLSLQPETAANLKCLGKLFNTGNPAELKDALTNALDESLARTSLQVNLNDLSGKPTETDVDMSFYDAATGELKYNFYHSINARGEPDTLAIAPDFKYKLQIHTIPPIVVDNITIKKNRHNIVNVKAPQGYLNFTLQGTISKSAAMDRIKCLLHKPGETQTLSIQKINSKEKYLDGTYELEVLTLPRLTVKNVKIEQSKTTDVEIPAPGIVTLNKTFDSYGAIFIIEDGKMKKIYDLRLKDKQETLALQPGKYHLVYRSKAARTIHTTVDKEFEIASGGSLSLKL